MATWYVNDLSKLTHVSVRALHHYDALGLLKPSVRLANGYRVYNWDDVLKLQQIVALKSFGFKLSTIRTMMKEQGNLLEQLKIQQKFVRQQLASLQEADQILTKVLRNTRTSTAVDPSTIFNLLEVYYMTKRLEKSWVGKILTPQQLDEFVQLEKKFTMPEHINYGKRWAVLIAKVRQHLHEDPQSAIGKQLSTEWMELVNEWYGDKPALKNALWKAFKEGKIPTKDNDFPIADISPEMAKWIDAAVTTKGKK